MADKHGFLGGFEELCLRAVMRLGENAYGVTIRRTVEEVTERPSSYGAIYTTLERLEQKGFLTSYQGDPTPQRGGRAKRFFEITGTGAQALHEADRIRAALQGGMQPAGGAV